MKKLFFLLGCLLVLGSSPAWAQTSEVDVVVVRVFDSNSQVVLAVRRGEEDMRWQEYKGKDANKAYQQLVKELYQQGYVLQGTIPGPQSPDSSTSTLLFIKLPKP